MNSLHKFNALKQSEPWSARILTAEEQAFLKKLKLVEDKYRFMFDDEPFHIDTDSDTFGFKRAKDIHLPEDRAGEIFERVFNKEGIWVKTYNVYQASFVGDTSVVEFRYYFMEPSSQEMQTVSIYVDAEGKDEANLAKEVAQRYDMQVSDGTVTEARDKDWEDFFRLVEEMEVEA